MGLRPPARSEKLSSPSLRVPPDPFPAPRHLTGPPPRPLTQTPVGPLPVLGQVCLPVSICCLTRPGPPGSLSAQRPRSKPELAPALCAQAPRPGGSVGGTSCSRSGLSSVHPLSPAPEPSPTAEPTLFTLPPLPGRTGTSDIGHGHQDTGVFLWT